MGVDFIREQSGKPWRKRWNKGLDRLKAPDLFDVQFASEYRMVTADLDSGKTLNIGDEVVVQCQGSSVVVTSGHLRVGGIADAPADIRTALANCGGVALGTVQRLGLFGNSAELSIR